MAEDEIKAKVKEQLDKAKIESEEKKDKSLDEKIQAAGKELFDSEIVADRLYLIELRGAVFVRGASDRPNPRSTPPCLSRRPDDPQLSLCCAPLLYPLYLALQHPLTTPPHTANSPLQNTDATYNKWATAKFGDAALEMPHL